MTDKKGEIGQNLGKKNNHIGKFEWIFISNRAEGVVWGFCGFGQMICVSERGFCCACLCESVHAAMGTS